MLEKTVSSEGVLPNGITYRIHHMQGFSGNSELAVEIDGKFVSAISVNKKRNGSVMILSTISGNTLIKHEEPKQKIMEKPTDLLAGVK